MSLAYESAEIFIAALGKNANFSLIYDQVKSLISQANEEIKTYLKEKCENDLLFIFKKFPDVFVYNAHCVSLTDAFLSLYAFPNSVSFSTKYNCTNTYEISVIEYFKLILSRCGTCPYTHLFNLLLSQNGAELASYYSHYTTGDMYKFFQIHSQTFRMENTYVYLNKNSASNSKPLYLDEQMSAKYMKRLSKAVYFLLTCFESLHYIELKQCISFVLGSVMEFLNQHSLIKQRQIFENLPETTMDRLGFLSLKNFDASMPKSRKSRLILLIVCILAFEREMHFQKLVREVEQRSTTDVNSSLCSLSLTEQFKFFRNFSEYFVIINDGYVSLLSSFVFPLCSFENSCLGLIQPQIHPIVPKPYISYPVIGILCAPPYDKQGSKILSVPSVTPVTATVANHVINSKSQSTSDKSVDSKKCTTDISYLPVYSNLLNLRTRLAMLFLLENLDSAVCVNILKSFLYVLDDVRLKFLSLPLIQQQAFIKECCGFYNNQIISKTAKDKPEPYINSKEKNLLFIVYMLIKEGKMHFVKLTKLMSSTINDSLPLRISEQFKYFKEMNDYLNVCGDGYISLNTSFNTINCAINSFYGIISDILIAPGSSTGVNEQSNNVAETNEVFIHDQKITESCMFTNKSLTYENDVHAIKETSFVPENEIVSSLKFSFSIPTDKQIILFKRLEHSVLYLQNYYDPLSAKYILETILHSLTDVQTLFYKMSNTEKHEFIEKYFQFINNEFVIDISNPDQLSNTKLDEDEEAILLITYLLIKEKSLYYVNIVKMLASFEVKFSFCAKTASNQFKHFKNWEKYFVINGDGFVHLNPSFFSLSTIISSVSAFIPEIQRKLNTDIKIKSEANKNNTFNSSVQNSLQNIVVNVNGDKRETRMVDVPESINTESSNVSRIVELNATDLSDSCCSNSSTVRSEGIKRRKSRTRRRSKTHSRASSKTSVLSLESKERKSQNLSLCNNVKTIQKESYSKSECSLTDVVESGNVESAKISKCDSNVPQQHIQKPKDCEQNEKSKLSNAVFKDTDLGTENKRVNNPKLSSISSLVLKPHDLSTNLQRNEDLSNFSRNASAGVSPKSLDDIEIFSSDGSEVFYSSPSNYDDLNSQEMKENSSKSSGTELLNSLLSELNLNDPKTDSSDFSQMVTPKESKPLQKQKNCDKKESFENNYVKITSNRRPNTTSENNLLLAQLPSFSSQQKHPSSSSLQNVTLNQDENRVIELRAVNFFYIIWGKYNTGVSADFLIKHLNLASSEVRSYMFQFYQNDKLSFFKKHKHVFYVSPQTNHIFLVKKG